MANVTHVRIPPKLCFSKNLGKNNIRQLKFPEMHLGIAQPDGAASTPGTSVEMYGRKVFISKTKKANPPPGFDDLMIMSGSELTWARQSEINNPKWKDVFDRRQAVTSHLRDNFKLIEEECNADNSVKTPGLRSPQIGAIHSALGHLRMSSDVSTIVMPTGTGKTDTMVGLMVLLQPECLLIVVPTDALRKQLAEKFMTFGVLVKFGLLPEDASYPIVGVLKSGFSDSSEMKVFCEACNVIITTMPLLSTFKASLQASLASYCTHLFIDEAHHVKAVTWHRLRAQFKGKPVLQFTATPYRNDGQHVDGRIIFNYPILRAQREGYFKKIVLKELWEPVDSDEAIAKAAINQLKEDIGKGLDHIVMARTATIQRAETLETIYADHAKEFSPVVVHSDLRQDELTTRMSQLYSRQSRVAICVSMFGEGFDFPELKIAALHDIHQSLAVTIQFTGRFIRPNPMVGDATIIVNRADAKVNESVRELYAQGESADWNSVLRKLTEGAAQNQIDKENFYQSFGDLSTAAPVQNVTPKMSAVVYQTHLEKWTPWKIDGLPLAKRIQGPVSVSLKETSAFFVTLTSESVEWADPTELINRNYDLFALFWDPDTRLLYINSSDNSSVHDDLARAVGGDDATLLRGINAFRVFHGINRLLLRNMGLNDRLRRSVRFVMYTGSDIRDYLENSQTHGKEKTHVFGDGFDGTSRVTIGSSKKGRIWSWKEAKDLLDWKTWCKGIGGKLLDNTIVPDSFLEDSMLPEDISKTPDLYPLVIEWPDEFYHRSEESIFLQTTNTTVPFFNVSIELLDPGPGIPIRFKVFSEEFSASYILKFVDGKVAYACDSGEDLLVRFGRKSTKLSEYFGFAHPIIRYEKDCFSKGDQLLKPRQTRIRLFNPDNIVIWNWDGVDPKRESQTIMKIGDSIQRRTIDTISDEKWEPNYKVIFDDDAAGEAADVVGIAILEGKVLVDLFHCKYTKHTSGKRIKDLYEVCGQAVRSRKWRDDIDRLFTHLANREKTRLKKSGVSRFERGDLKILEATRFAARALIPEFRVFIIQPGISKSQVPDDQRELLGTTELYLHETVGIQFVAVGGT